MPHSRECFNPCFAGFPFRTWALQDRPFELLFQSLFCWISLSDLEEYNYASGITSVSILVLLDFPFGRYFRRHNAQTTGCFNPCFAGFPFRTATFLLVILHFKAVYQALLGINIVVFRLLVPL